jgi:hypothetical protein
MENPSPAVDGRIIAREREGNDISFARLFVFYFLKYYVEKMPLLPCVCVCKITKYSHRPLCVVCEKIEGSKI